MMKSKDSYQQKLKRRIDYFCNLLTLRTLSFVLASCRRAPLCNNLIEREDALKGGEEKMTVSPSDSATIANSFVYQAEVRIPVNRNSGSGEVDAVFVNELMDVVNEAARIDPKFFLQYGDSIFMKTDLGIKCFVVPKEVVPVIKPLSLSYSNSIWRFLLGRGGRWTIKGFHLKDTTISIATSDSKRYLRIHSFSQQILSDNGQNDEANCLDILHCEEPTSLRLMGYGRKNQVYISASRKVNIRGRTVEVRSKAIDTYSAYWKGVDAAWMEVSSKFYFNLWSHSSSL